MPSLGIPKTLEFRGSGFSGAYACRNYVERLPYIQSSSVQPRHVRMRC